MSNILDIIKSEVNRFFLNENMDVHDWYEIEDEIVRDVFRMINSRQHVKFGLIPKNQYYSALQEFMKYGEFFRFPESKIFQWKDLILTNIAKLNVLTSIGGHTTHFPFDEFYDEFDYNPDTGGGRSGEFSMWCKEKYEETGDDNYLKKYNWNTASEFLEEVKNIDDYLPLFSNGQWVLSDYGLTPLFKLGEEMANTSSTTELIVLINKVLDVSHQRSDLAELFIEGGSATLNYISNN